MSERLNQLGAAGFPVAPGDDRQRTAIESLTEEEVAVLLSVRERIEAAAPDVEGHARSVGGYCW
jgi:hypothetical protein